MLTLVAATLFQFSWAQPGTALRPFLPELVLVATIVGVLICPFFSRRSNGIAGGVALLGLILAVAFLYVSGAEPQTLYRGLLRIDPLALYWRGLLYIFTAGIVLLWFSSSASTMHEGDGPEFFTLLLGAALGMSLMVCTTNLLMLVMALELASLPSYVLAGFRKTKRLGAEASLKYVLFGSAASAIMIFGTSLLYGLYGTLQIEEILPRLHEPHISAALLAVGVIGIGVGLAFKIAAVPFHLWCPDVFQGANIEISAFLSVASKGAGLLLLVRVAALAGVPGAIVIGILGAITATVGNAAALAQTSVKRLLAYSSIAQAGYMLCAAALVVAPGQQIVAIQALLIYLTIYLFMNLGAFVVTAMVERQAGTDDISAFDGLGRRAMIPAVSMAFCLISLIGLPPLAGFWGKFFLMTMLFRAGGWWIVLVVVIGVNTVLSMPYYLRIVRGMFFRESSQPRFHAHPTGLMTAGICAAALIALFLGFANLQKCTEAAARRTVEGMSPPSLPPSR